MSWVPTSSPVVVAAVVARFAYYRLCRIFDGLVLQLVVALDLK